MTVDGLAGVYLIYGIGSIRNTWYLEAANREARALTEHTEYGLLEISRGKVSRYQPS